LPPPEKTVLDKLSIEGFDTIGVGKIGDIFAMQGLKESYPTHSNAEGMAKAEELLERDFNGLCFINLVDFDMLFGHRQDAKGYANALNEFDSRLGGFIEKMKPTDALIITADHGCDPSDSSTDHSREYVPFLAYGKGIDAVSIGTKKGFSFVGNYIMKLLCKGEQ
jgi:phosphopentomutase